MKSLHSALELQNYALNSSVKPWAATDLFEGKQLIPNHIEKNGKPHHVSQK